MHQNEISSLKTDDVIRNRSNKFRITNVQPSLGIAVGVRIGTVVISKFNCESVHKVWSKKQKPEPRQSAVGSMVVVAFAGNDYKALITEELES